MTKKSVKEVTGLKSSTRISLAFLDSAASTATFQEGGACASSGRVREGTDDKDCCETLVVKSLLRLAYYNLMDLEIRRRLRRAARTACFLALPAAPWCPSGLAAIQVSKASLPTYSVLADSEVSRERSALERVRMLVENGTLPRVRLREAEESLEDAEDKSTIAHTLYGSTPVEEMTQAQALNMEAAARRRVARQQKVVAERKAMLATGIVARTNLESATAELDARNQVLDLVGTRMHLLEELKRMAESERMAEHLPGAGIPNMKEAIARNAVTRFNGTAPFKLEQLAALSGQFQKKFGGPLPVSAIGETAVHRALGLDHRDRVDIALGPDTREGLWLRRLLEKLKLPYLAFRSAVAGAATAPHIHIGLGSTRLQPSLTNAAR